jgi:ERO1-like protein beta
LGTTDSISMKPLVLCRGGTLFLCVEIVPVQSIHLKRYSVIHMLLRIQEDIPEIWRASNLGKVTGPIVTHPFLLPTPRSTDVTTTPLGGALGKDTAEMCIYEGNGYDSERDYCVPEDETNLDQSVYVSLMKNPERYTGYTGDHANAVWREIYRENCFELYPQNKKEESAQIDHSPKLERDFDALFGRMEGRLSGATAAEEDDQLLLENTCLEKRVFWRLISGMHTSISVHLCWDFLNQTTGEWVDQNQFQFNCRLPMLNASNLDSGTLSG